MRHVDGSGHRREAREEVEVDRAIGVSGLRSGEKLTEHLTPPKYRPEEPGAHARRLENVSIVCVFVRVPNEQGVLGLHHPPREDVSKVLMCYSP